MAIPGRPTTLVAPPWFGRQRMLGERGFQSRSGHTYKQPLVEVVAGSRDRPLKFCDAIGRRPCCFGGPYAAARLMHRPPSQPGVRCRHSQGLRKRWHIDGWTLFAGRIRDLRSSPRRPFLFDRFNCKAPLGNVLCHHGFDILRKFQVGEDMFRCPFFHFRSVGPPFHYAVRIHFQGALGSSDVKRDVGHGIYFVPALRQYVDGITF